MKTIVVLLGVIFCLVAVSGRNVHDLKSEDDNSDVKLENQNDHSQMRHRRRSRQSFFDPHYFPFYDNRRDDNWRNYNNRQQEDLLSKILNEIEELSSYIKRPPPPPPPPQIIYVPVPYPVSQCSSPGIIPNLTDRWPIVEDDNQIWGQVVNNLDSNWKGEGSRPINLNPIVTEEETVKPPPVEHGSSQAGCKDGFTKCNGTVRNRRVFKRQFLPKHQIK